MNPSRGMRSQLKSSKLPLNASSVSAQRLRVLRVQSGRHSSQPAVKHVQSVTRSIEPEVSTTSSTSGLLAAATGSS